jgi:hypothetical protein
LRLPPQRRRLLNTKILFRRFALFLVFVIRNYAFTLLPNVCPSPTNYSLWGINDD